MPESFKKRLDGLFDEKQSAGQGIFFVSGYWRSGTSWLGRMIGSHPSAYVCHYELQTFMRDYGTSPFSNVWKDNPFLDVRYRTCQKAGFLSMLQHLHMKEKPAAHVMGDRSPGADIGLVKDAFPDAKAVVILRDARDVCVSFAYHAQNTKQTKAFERSYKGLKLAPDFVQEFSHRYAGYLTHYLDAGQRYRETVMLLGYEDLNADPLSTMTRVFDFLQLPVSDEQIADICRDHAFEAGTNRQPGEEDTGSYSRKGIVGDWKGHFTKQNLAVFEDIMGDAHQRYLQLFR